MTRKKSPAAPALTGDLRRWSPAMATRYRQCPAAQRYADQRAPREPKGTASRRGQALHAAMAAAYTAAQTEATARPGDLLRGEQSMHRYWAAARAELGRAWAQHELSGARDSRALAHETVAALTRTLAERPLPGPGVVVAVEAELHGRTAGGVPVMVRPDLVLRQQLNGRPGPVMTVVDWKSGSVAGFDVGADLIMLLYVALLADIYGSPDRADRAGRGGVEVFRVEQVSMLTGTVVTATVTPDRVAAAVLELERLALDEAERGATAAARPGEHCAVCPFRRGCPDTWPPARLGLDVITAAVRAPAQAGAR